MKFTQFLLPHGERRPMEIDRSPEIEAKAAELVKRGCYFEIEILRTDKINMDCQQAGELICGELCDNGPPVPEHVDKLVNRAYDIVVNAKDEEE
jgi:hypothetical protein